MNDHAGVWDPVENFPIAKLFMEEEFHCKDGTYSASIAADAAVARSSSPAAATRDKALKTQSGPTFALRSHSMVAPCVAPCATVLLPRRSLVCPYSCHERTDFGANHADHERPVGVPDGRAYHRAHRAHDGVPDIRTPWSCSFGACGPHNAALSVRQAFSRQQARLLCAENGVADCGGHCRPDRHAHG